MNTIERAVALAGMVTVGKIVAREYCRCLAKYREGSTEAFGTLFGGALQHLKDGVLMNFPNADERLRGELYAKARDAFLEELAELNRTAGQP